jgi:hypothetical protein
VPSPNEIIIAAAGGGKTTRIVKRALANGSVRSALLTYTQNNVREIEKRIYHLNASIPPQIGCGPGILFCSANWLDPTSAFFMIGASMASFGSKSALSVM